VPGGVIADHIEDGGTCAAGIVKIGDSVCKPRPQVEQGHSGLAFHSGIAVSSAAAATFKKAKERLDSRNLLEGVDNVDFRRSRIGKTDFDPP